MADDLFLRSELLCFLQNNASSTARNVLVSRITSFYENDEVSEAKALLFSTADSLKAKGLLFEVPRMIQRRNCDGRKKVEVEDILDLWEGLDRAKADVPSFF